MKKLGLYVCTLGLTIIVVQSLSWVFDNSTALLWIYIVAFNIATVVAERATKSRTS